MHHNVAIIGGSTGLGAKIAEYVIDDLDPTPLIIGREQQHTIATEEGRNAILKTIEEYPKVLGFVFLNAFDHAAPEAQELMFKALWESYKDSHVTFVVIGSTAKMWGWNASSPVAKDYSKAKKKLYETVFYSTWDDNTKARSILIEPSFVENVVDYFEDKGQLYLIYEDFIGMIDAAINMSFYLKLTCITGKGLYTATDIKSD